VRSLVVTKRWFQDDTWSVLVGPPSLNNTCGQQVSSLAQMIFYFIFSFCWFLCITLQIFKITLQFILLSVLFEIIYKIDFFFQSHPPLFIFLICQIQPSFFLLLIVSFEIVFKIEFVLRFHPHLVFFSIQI
jgi:hypothetical protein